MNKQIFQVQTFWFSAIGAAFLAGLLAYVFTSGGMSDEVYYIEPGVNMALGRGFVSGFTYTVNPDQTWGCSNPGMPLLYGCWFSVAGFGLFQSKLLSILLHLSGVAVIVHWAKSRLSLSSAGLALIFAALLAPRTMTWVVAGCRTDVFAALLFGLFLHVNFPPRYGTRPKQLWLSALLGGLSVAIGLHFTGFFALAFATIICFRACKSTFLNALLYGVGAGVGLLAMYLGYRNMGIWSSFLESRLWHYQGHEMPWVPKGINKYTMNPDALALAFVAIGLAVYWHRSNRAPGRLAGFGAAIMALSIFAFVPVAINLIGIYYNSYGWMVWIPMVLLLAPSLSVLASWIPVRWVSGITILTVVMYACVTVYLVNKNLKQTDEVERAAQHLACYAGSCDKIATSTAAYYRLKKEYLGLYVAYGSSANWPPEVRKSIKYILNRRDDAAKAADGLGGYWEEIPGEHMSPGWVLLVRKSLR